jgi:hypothetical protein
VASEFLTAWGAKNEVKFVGGGVDIQGQWPTSVLELVGSLIVRDAGLAGNCV